MATDMIVSMTSKARQEIYKGMDKVTQEAALEGAKKLQAGFQIALLVQYDLGVLVNSVFEAAHLNDAQRKQEIKQLSVYWSQPSLTSTTLYDLRNVATAFTREFVKSQWEERLANGQYLTWSHFRELQKISLEKRQLSILKQVRQHGWSANELALELQGKQEATVKRSGGRKPALPKTPVAMLQKIFTTVQLADNYLTAMFEPLGGIFLEMAPAELNGQFVTNIDNTLQRVEDLQDRLQVTVQQLRKVKSRAQQVSGGKGRPVVDV